MRRTGKEPPYNILGQELRGIEWEPPKGYDVLLGMDVICQGSLKVEGNGTFSFAF